MNIIDQLKQKYPKINYDILDDKNSVSMQLFMRYAWRVHPKYYGFDLGNVPFIWFHIINEFLEYLEKEDPDFKILQIKTKYGRVAVHLEFNLPPFGEKKREIIRYIRELENWLYSEKLIY